MAFICGELQKARTLRRLCWATAMPDGPRGSPDDGGGLARERVAPVGPAGPVDGVLQTARDRAVVLRRDEEDGVDGRDRVLEGPGDRRKIRVVVVAVERQILELDLRHVELGRCQADQGR